MPHRRRHDRPLAEADDLRVLVDRDRPTGRWLRQGDMDASYVDLADPGHLHFDYLRWIRCVLREAGARRVLHLGAGAGSLARALVAEAPEGRHLLVERDPAVIAFAREHLALRSRPNLKIRVADGLDELARQPDGSWDAVVIDAFTDGRVPTHLLGPEALAHLRRVAPLVAFNQVDPRPVPPAGPGDAVLQIGRPGANRVTVTWRAPARLDLDQLATALAADPSPGRLTVLGPAP